MVRGVDAVDAATEAGPEGRGRGEMAAHIARVAARLFASGGFDATSVREIVEAAGVTKPTLYYHFGSKQGLGEALLTRPMTGFIATLRGLIAGEDDPVRLLKAAFEAHLSFCVEEPDRARFFYAICFGPNSSSLRDEMHRFGEAMDSAMLDCARKLAEARAIDPARVEACAQVCRGLIISSTLDHIIQGRPLEPDLAGRLVVDLLRGFGEPGLTIDGGREGGS